MLNKMSLPEQQICNKIISFFIDNYLIFINSYIEIYMGSQSYLKQTAKDAIQLKKSCSRSLEIFLEKTESDQSMLQTHKIFWQVFFYLSHMYWLISFMYLCINVVAAPQWAMSQWVSNMMRVRQVYWPINKFPTERIKQ